MSKEYSIFDIILTDMPYVKIGTMQGIQWIIEREEKVQYHSVNTKRLVYSGIPISCSAKISGTQTDRKSNMVLGRILQYSYLLG